MGVFKFKQFEVDQTGCAMKINTDGVLLGAMVNAQRPGHILDIGTGTGVIALMLAQRFPEAFISAVEIDEQAALTAEKNFRLSAFAKRLSVYHSAVQAFACNQKFDLIVSNPPFFVNDLKSAEEKKGIARHADEGFFSMLVEKANDLLSAEGALWLILPLKQAEEVVQLADKHGLWLLEKVHIHSDASKPAFRQIIKLGKGREEIQESHFYIYEGLKVHTAAYQDLLKDFFLAF